MMNLVWTAIELQTLIVKRWERLCPKCIAKRCACFGKALEMWDGLIFNWNFDEKKDMDYLAYSNKYLLEEPLIDHSDDIDKNIPS